MIHEKRLALAALSLIFLFFFGFSLFINLPPIHQGFLFADQAIYFAMTQSIAYDGDLEYTRKDLSRYYHDFEAGPQGIFLKKGQDGKIFYAKSFAYSLFAAPFVRVFGYNGFLVFHSLLLLLILLLGFSYFSLTCRPVLSLGLILTFLFASVAGVYYLWISPDFFNLALVFLILFLWLYKVRKKEKADSESEDNGEKKPRPFLLSGWSDALAGFLVGIAAFSKPPNAVLMAPLVLFALFRKRWGNAFLIILCFVLSAGILFGANYLLTSDWNFMGGERKSFYGTFPLEKPEMTFDSVKGVVMTSENYFERFLLPVKLIFFNLFYFFFGRFTGIIWYFFPAFLLLFIFLFAKLPRRGPEQWLILAALAAEILIYITLMPDNYGGGGGSLANRYFLNIYPFFFFLPRLKIDKKQLALCWIFAAIFISQILVSPFRSSAYPATHAKKFPIKVLPVEMTLINNVPTNTNPNGFRVPFGTPPNNGYMHFLDDNFWPKQEPNGVWTRGNRTAEMILKTYFPVKEIIVHLLNNPRRENVVKVKVDGHGQKVSLGSKQRTTLRFPVGNGFQIRQAHLYRLKVKAAKGSIPYFEDDESKERRHLGVFFELEIIPKT